MLSVDIGLKRYYYFSFCQYNIEMATGMGFPILWESREMGIILRFGNGKGEGMGKNVDGNGIDPSFYGGIFLRIFFVIVDLQ